MLVFRRTVTVGMEAADVGRMEALMIGVLVVWALVALGVAVVLGRSIRLADARAPDVSNENCGVSNTSCAMSVRMTLVFLRRRS